MTDDISLDERAVSLRRAFDESFAAAVVPASQNIVDLFGANVAGTTFGVRLDEVADLHSGVAVTAIPGPLPGMLGVSGLGGALVAVHDLAALLGRSRGQAHWIVRIKGEALGFAFAAFDGHVRLNGARLAAGGGTDRFVTGIAHTERGDWPVLNIPALVAAIRDRLPLSANKE